MGRLMATEELGEPSEVESFVSGLGAPGQEYQAWSLGYMFKWESLKSILQRTSSSALPIPHPWYLLCLTVTP